MKVSSPLLGFSWYGFKEGVDFGGWGGSLFGFGGLVHRAGPGLVHGAGIS